MSRLGVVADRTAVHGVGQAQLHVRTGREVTLGVLEESGTGLEISRLEQRDDHGQQREGVEVVVGPGDEPEHLDLGLDRRAVVGQDVHPVVLGEHRWRRTRLPGKAKPRAWYSSHTLRPSVGREMLEGLPLRRQLLVVLAERPGRVEPMGGMHDGRRLLGVPLAFVPVAREVDRSQRQRPRR